MGHGGDPSPSQAPSSQGADSARAEDVPCAVLGFDEAGSLAWCNRVARESWSWLRETPRLAHHAVGDVARQAIDRREPVTRERTLEAPDGERAVEVKARPSDAGAIVVVHDVSGYRERIDAALHQERVLEEAQEVAHIGSWTWDVRADEVSWSPELYRTFGRDPDVFEATFEGYMACIHPEDTRRVQSIVEEGYRTGEPFAFEHRIVRPDGRARYLHCRGQVVLGPDGEPSRMVGTAQDITQRHAAEERLREYALQLEHANRELERFAYVASHDLKEPLRMIHSYAQLLENRLQDPEDEDAIRECIRFVTEGTRRMHRLITDLLSYSRVDESEPDLEVVDLEAVLDDVLANLAPRVEQAGAEVTHDPLPEVTADETRIGLLLQNLLANGLKFHKDGQAPHVHVGVERETEPDAWQLTVSDDGIGFDPAYADRIFVMFKRLHDRASYPGTGVGLAICKKIAEQHGGEIWADANPGEGATFHVRIPTDPAATLQARQDALEVPLEHGLAATEPRGAQGDPEHPRTGPGQTGSGNSRQKPP